MGWGLSWGPVLGLCKLEPVLVQGLCVLKGRVPSRTRTINSAACTRSVRPSPGDQRDSLQPQGAASRTKPPLFPNTDRRAQKLETESGVEAPACRLGSLVKEAPQGWHLLSSPHVRERPPCCIPDPSGPTASVGFSAGGSVWVVVVAGRCVSQHG